MFLGFFFPNEERGRGIQKMSEVVALRYPSPKGLFPGTSGQIHGSSYFQ